MHQARTTITIIIFIIEVSDRDDHQSGEELCNNTVTQAINNTDLEDNRINY